jgi:hypothetical protein
VRAILIYLSKIIGKGRYCCIGWHTNPSGELGTNAPIVPQVDSPLITAIYVDQIVDLALRHYNAVDCSVAEF